MELKIDGESKTEGSSYADLKPIKQSTDKIWLKELPKTIWNHFKNNFSSWFLTIIGVAILTLFAWYYGLDKEISNSNIRIQNIENSVNQSEQNYKRKIENELKISKCKNGVILECYGVCKIQEIIKRQNACELIK